MPKPASQPTDYTTVPTPDQRVRVVVIEHVFYDNEGDLTSSLEQMRGYGAAEVMSDRIVQETFDEAYAILRKRHAGGSHV